MLVGEWWLTPQRAAVHRPSGTAVVADVHLGYAEARRRRGDAVPRASVAEALRPLALVLAEEQARRLVVAGDLFEEGCRPELVAELRRWLEDHAVGLDGDVSAVEDRPSGRRRNSRGGAVDVEVARARGKLSGLGAHRRDVATPAVELPR